MCDGVLSRTILHKVLGLFFAQGGRILSTGTVV
jgi:hypothetical protein